MIVNPGIRRFLGSAIQRLFNSASFYAPLTHTLALERGTGSPTFTRATTATVTDNEGILRTAIAGEARFVGARRVYNQVSASENLAAFTQTNCTYTKNLTGPDGVANSAGTLTATGANALFYKTLPVIIGRTVFSVQVKRLSGTGSIFISNDGANTFTDVTSQVSSGWIRVSSAQTLAVSNFPVIKIATSGDSIGIGQWQFEDITGRTDQTTPSEYVSVGVLSAPYHGAGVDGVKYFDTDLSGNPIAASTLKGYLSEPAATNLCLQSNAFTTTWTASGPPTITQNVVGPDGATSAWTLTDGTGGADHIISGNITFTAAAYTASVFIKKTVGATTFPVLWMIDAGTTTTSLCTADTNNGVATVWTANGFGLAMMAGASARCSSYNDNYWRFELTATGTAVAYNFKFGPALTTTANQSSGTFSAATTGSAVFYGAQVELGSSATSYIPTTTTAVARNADILTYPSAGNIDGTAGAAYVEASVNVGATPSRLLTLNSGTQVNALYAGGATVISMYDGSAALNGPAGSITADGIPRKYSSTWNATGTRMQVAASGTAGTAGTFDGDMTPNEIRVGGLYLAGNEWNGTIRNVRIWQRALSASEMQAITAS